MVVIAGLFAAIFSTPRANLGAADANDFALLDRVFQVRVWASDTYRDSEPGITRLHEANARGEKVPLKILLDVEPSVGPERVNRYNMFAAATVR